MIEKHKCLKCFKKFDTKFNLERHLIVKHHVMKKRR